MSDGERGRDLGHAETLAGPGGAPGVAATMAGAGSRRSTIAAAVDTDGETLAGSITDATSATIRGTGVAGDHATLLAVDDRAYAIAACTETS